MHMRKCMCEICLVHKVSFVVPALFVVVWSVPTPVVLETGGQSNPLHVS